MPRNILYKSKNMNTLSLIDSFIEKNSTSVDLLQNTWNNVWNENGIDSYSKLRLYKTIDKIDTLKKLGVNFDNKTILDIGCGNGATLYYLYEKYNITGVGIDISKDIININKIKFNLNTQIQFGLGDHRYTGFLKDSFDIVLSWGVMEHMSDYAVAIQEAKRVLKPGGVLVLIQPNLYSFGVLQEYYLRMTGRWRYGSQKNFTRSSLKIILKSLGFKKIIFFAKPPYGDMFLCRIADIFINKLYRYWGHYLYIISYK